MDVLNRANQLERSGRTIWHLEAGQPSTKAPVAALDAVQTALRAQALGYTEALGTPQLRERISQHYQEWYDVRVPPERIVITTGSSAGFVLAFLAAFDTGQALAIANPGYPAYRNISKALGLNAQLINCGFDEQFRLSAKSLAKQSAIDGLLVASPSNPCGTVIEPSELRRIVDQCAARKIWLISDEIYHGITYGRNAQTVLAFTPNAIVINSFSKYFSMTGWRIGWMVVPEHMVPTVEKLAQNFYISPPAVSQLAALHAFDAKRELEGHVQAYAHNRAVLLNALEKSTFGSIAPADGAFYLYADCSVFGLNSIEFTSRLLDETGVAATSGIDFDPIDGMNWVRFSYAGASTEIERAAAEIQVWSSTLVKV